MPSSIIMTDIVVGGITDTCIYRNAGTPEREQKQMSNGKRSLANCHLLSENVEHGNIFTAAFIG